MAIWKNKSNTNENADNQEVNPSHLNDDFDFDFDDEVTSTDFSSEGQNTINEESVARRAAAVAEELKIRNAYSKIINREYQPLRNDKQFYELYKAERTERFRSLDIVVCHICETHLGDSSYYYNYFKNNFFESDVNLKMISNLCDIISRLTRSPRDDDEYEELSRDKRNAIKVLTIAIVDLAEGSI